MKANYLILFSLILFFQCSNFKISNTEEKVFYFYFENNSKTMKKYYTGDDPITGKHVGPLKYLYDLKDIDNVIFITKKSNYERVKVSIKDTSNMNIKTIKWLNKMSPDREKRYNFFNDKSHTFHIIEKDTKNNQLYVIKNMTTINEIE